MKNIRKIVAILAAVLMFASVLPMSAFAAPGDVALDKNFDDGNAFFERGYVENGYMVFDATTADWQCAYQNVNGIKSNTLYKVTFKAMANKDAALNFKLQNAWAGAHVVEKVEVTTEWQDYELTINSGIVDNGAIVLFSSSDYAKDAAIYCIDDVKIVETVDPALIGKVVNGDFSDNSGWKLGSGASIANGMLTLTNVDAWSEAAMQTVPVKANTNYEITWKSQCVSGSGVTYMTLMDSTFANYTVTSGQIWMTDTSGNWLNHTVTLNTGDHESIIFKLTSEDGGNKVINIDDVKITEIKDPSFDGILYNGDFETGKLGAWTNLWGSNTIEMVDGQNSDYAVKVTGGSWTQVYQSVTVEPNTDYVYTAWAKDASDFSLWVKSAGGAANVADKALATGSDWQLNILSFNSGDNTSVWIGLMSLAAGGTAIVDNAKVAKAAPVSNDDYLSNTNFEGASLNSWSLIWSEQVAASIVADGKDSNFAAYVFGKPEKQYGQFRQQVAVEANTDYKVSVWAKNVNGMSLLVKDGADTYNINNVGASAGDEWTLITNEFNSGDNTSVWVGVMVEAVGGAGTFDNFLMEKVVCEHEYDGCDDADCNLCGEIREPGHNLTYTPAKEAIDCANPGNIEYWFCSGCYEYFADAEATEYINPWYINITVDCVRPEGIADCATVTCETCGNEIYGYGEHDVPACKGGTCSKCNAEVEGYGCQNFDTPACEDGFCSYCGDPIAGFGHENGAWAPCLDGECAYGCGLTYPATEDHVDEDANDYCDNCFNHLACIDEDGDGWCDDCWSEMPVADVLYGDADGDGEISTGDVVTLQQFLAEWDDVEIDLAAADADGDGEISTGDVVILQQFLAEWDDVVLGPTA